MESGYYDMITIMLSAAGIVTQSKSVDLVKDMCQQVDRVLKDLAETAEKTGYTLVVVGTHAEATCVPENEDDKAPCNNVPCIIRPCEGQTLQRVECRCFRWDVMYSGGVFVGECCSYLSEAGRC